MALSRRFQFGLTTGIVAGGVFVFLLIALGPPAREPDSMARGSNWQDEVRAPRRIIVHRIDQRAVKAEHSVDGWKSVQKLELIPSSKEGQALAALFAQGRISTARVPELHCTFNPELGLEFIAAGGRRSAILSLDCSAGRGDSGIRSFDARDMAAFAATLFPDDERFRPKSDEEADPNAP